MSTEGDFEAQTEGSSESTGTGIVRWTGIVTGTGITTGTEIVTATGGIATGTGIVTETSGSAVLCLPSLKGYQVQDTTEDVFIQCHVVRKYSTALAVSF